ncbi:MAG: hypothetical protein ACRD0W_08460 [Acidimicrobiales bacterium]
MPTVAMRAMLLAAQTGGQPLVTQLTDHPWRWAAEEVAVRWRPDRDPASCGYGQLEEPVRFDLADVLAGRVS